MPCPDEKNLAETQKEERAGQIIQIAPAERPDSLRRAGNQNQLIHGINQQSAQNAERVQRSFPDCLNKGQRA